MSDTGHRRTATTTTLVGVAVAALLSVLLPVWVWAAPPPPGATSISFTSIASDYQLPATPGSDGLVYVVAGQPFDVGLEFLDQDGNPAPLSTTQDVTVTVSHAGTALATAAVGPGATTATLPDLVIATAAPDVTLTASASTRPRAVGGTSPEFDVLITSDPVNTSGRTSTGGESTPEGCVATPAQPVCGDLYAPVAGFVAGGQLSRGLCAADLGRCTDSYLQAIAALNAGAGNTDPATLVMKCDKTLCGGGAINKKKLWVTLSSDPDSEFAGNVEAPACLAKGTVTYDPFAAYGPGNRPFCVDYVQSTRDNAGDTHLRLLFVVDAKVRFP